MRRATRNEGCKEAVQWVGVRVSRGSTRSFWPCGRMGVGWVERVGEYAG